MRKVVSGLFISLDGVVEAPYKWQFDVFDDDMVAAMERTYRCGGHHPSRSSDLSGVGALWPTSTDEPYASHINNTPKLVVSTTLDKVEWQNSTLVKANLAQEIARLKQQPGKNIGVAGSPTLVYSLLQNDLLDELILMVHPVIAGSGKRLFRDGGDLKRLRLVDSKTTGSGVAILTYQPRSE